MTNKTLLKIFTFITLISLTSSCNESSISLVETPGESTFLITDKNVDELENPKDVAYAFINKLHSFKTYEIVDKGSVSSKKGFINYQQIINAQTIKNGDEYFYTQTSNSLLVNTTHTAFYKNDLVCYDDDYKVSNITDYLETYGNAPNKLTLAGYIVNENTLLSAECISKENDLLTYKFILDGENAGTNMKIQMKEFGDLSQYPVFGEVSVTLVLHNNWIPLTLTINARYDISIAILGSMSCIQNVTSTYKNVNIDQISIPNRDVYIEKINAK